MARPLRIQRPGLTYHVTARGNRRMAIYRDDVDRARFLELLQETGERHGLFCRTYCLMNNHYHVVVTTTSANLSKALQHLNGSYAQWWNRRHRHNGHLMQGRFHARVVQEDRYLLEVCRYVVMNPVAAKLVARPSEWRWSSYRALAGLDPVPAFLQPDPVLAAFGAPGSPAAARRYRRFVESALHEKGAMSAIAVPSIIGEATFARELLGAIQRSTELTRAHWHQARPSLESIFLGAARRQEREACAYTAHCRYEYSMREIADYLGVHYTTVSRAIAMAMTRGSDRAKCDSARSDPS